MTVDKRTTIHKYRLVLGLTLVATLVTTACGGNVGTEAIGEGGGGDAPLRKVNFGLSSGALTSHAYFAAEALGYFEDEGLDVVLTPTEGSSAVAQQLVAGNFDVGQGGIDVMLAALDDADLYFFAYALREYRDWIVPEDSQISSLQDMEGTVVGVSNLSGGEVPVVRHFLREAGLDPETDVDLVAAGETPATLAVAFEQDRIDSFAGAQSGIVPFKLETGMELRSMFPDTFADAPVEYLTTTEAHKDDNELMVGIARAAAKGSWFCQTDAEACLDAVEVNYPELVEDRETAAAILDLYLELTRPDTIDSEPVYGRVEAQEIDQYLDIFGTGEDPLIAHAAEIDLDNHIVGGLVEKINDFDFDAVAQEANSYGD